MQDLTVRESNNPKITWAEVEATYPNFVSGFLKARELLSRIHSFDDVETYLLRGQGLSPRTYASYMVGVRQLYQHTGGLVPTQVTPGHIESYYDALLARGLNRNTAANRVHGLRRFFRGIGTMIPGFVSPFDVMDERLVKKLAKTKRGQKQKALRVSEVKAILAWLSEDTTVEGLELAAIVRFLLGSGLRAGELAQVRMRNLDFDTDAGWTVSGIIGKGGKPIDEQEIADPGAVDLAVRAFRARHKRQPHADDFLFWASDGPIKPHGLWWRVRKLGEKAKAAGIVTRDLRWSPHLFRRSVATLLDSAGMSIVGIQGFLRHEDVSTTAKHYVDNQQKAGPLFAAAMGVTA